MRTNTFSLHRFTKPQLILTALAVGMVGLIAILLVSAATPSESDINKDGKVDISDLSLLLSKFGTTDPAADVNKDGKVDISDLSGLLTNFGSTVTSTVGAPAAPTGLVATPGDHKVTLDWANNLESDFSYYAVRRSTTSDPATGTWTRLPGNLTTSTVVDADPALVPDTTYYYYVTAVDVDGNISARSAVVSAKPTGTISPTPSPSPSPTPAGSRDEANVIWSDDDNLSKIPLLHYNNQEAGSTVTLSSTVARHSGGKSIRINIPATVGNGGNPGRAQVVPSIGSGHGTYGDTRWYGVSVYFDQNWTWDGDQLANDAHGFLDLITFRWTSLTGGGDIGATPGSGPNLGGRVLSGQRGWHAYFPPKVRNTPNPYEVIAAPFVKGQWIDIIQEIKWSTGSDGYRRIWMNGKLVDEHHGPTVQFAGSKWGPRFGVYEGDNIKSARTVYYDEYRVGKTRDAVDPAID
jgi:hypothetical protein